MRLSIITPVLNSHEIVRRQVLHYEAMNLPSDVEVLFIDDGSDPPIETYSDAVRVLMTNDKREWTWPLARNFGARHAGEYLLMTDLDYIVTRDSIEAALAFDGDKMCFKREFGVLDENGQFTQDKDVLISYGLPASRFQSGGKGTKMPPHPNNFVMKKSVYWDLGGFLEDRIGQPYPQGEDGHFKRQWKRAVAKGRFKDSAYRPTIYMFPNGQFCGDVDFNPHGLFHNLTRKNDKNPWFKKQRYPA